MSRLEERAYTYFTTVRGMCRGCRKIVPARVFFQDESVFQEALCPRCRNGPAKIAHDKSWYLEQVLKPMPDRSPLKGSHALKKGCPGDCGPCTWHASPCQLPVISITNACNMNCPICFTYNRNDRHYFMPVEEMERTVDWIVESSGMVDLINITGGEPTLHPQLIDLLKCCDRPEIGRITVNSNGIALAEDMGLCERLSEINASVILSFNTFDREASFKLHGQDVVETKLKALGNLTRAGVKTTLLNVMVRGVNEDAVGGILELMKENSSILSLTVQTMTYTGQGGGRYPGADRIPVDEATRIVCSHSSGDLVFSDFVSRPSAHPLCYQVCYFLKTGESFTPFARFLPPEKLQDLMKDSYLIRVDDEEEFLKDIVNDLYARGEEKLLRVFRTFMEALFPRGRPLTAFERQRVAESSVRTVCIHTHMDEDNFDCSRAMMCPDLVPSEPGRFIPACTYNLFYRMKDERFFMEGP